MKYLIEVEVDQDKLRRSRGIDVGEENEYEESIETLIIAEMGWVDDSGIYLTSVKEVESDVTGEYKLPESVWEFVEEYFPNYSNSDLIALADDLEKIVNENAEPDSDAHEYFVTECRESLVTAKEHHEATHRRVYEMAIEGYIKSLKEKRQKNG